MSSTTTPQSQSGVTVSSGVAAGGLAWNHAEGIVVRTDVTAGPGGGGGIWLNHAEGIVVATDVTAGGWSLNHAEGVVVATDVTAGPTAPVPGLLQQAGEGELLVLALERFHGTSAADDRARVTCSIRAGQPVAGRGPSGAGLDPRRAFLTLASLALTASSAPWSVGR